MGVRRIFVERKALGNLGVIVKLIIASLLFAVSLSASAQCFGPGGCSPGVSYGPSRVCIGTACVPIEYFIWDRFVLAKARLPTNGYPQLGWSGPCFDVDVLQCPGAWGQAAQDLELNLLRIHRALKP